MADMEISDADIVNVLEDFQPSEDIFLEMENQQQQEHYDPMAAAPMTMTTTTNDGLLSSSSPSSPLEDYHHHPQADVVSLTSNSREYTLTGRPSTQLYLSCDPDTFSEYQVLVRKSIEVFEATADDVTTNAQGRNKPIVLGQVGIRCIYCARVPPSQRCRGAMYYPSKLEGVYQAAQNLANAHLLQLCPLVPQPVRDALLQFKDKKSSAGGGKTSWSERLTALGVYEDECGLRFANRIDALHHPHRHT
jgi:hypothetical protein